MIKISFSGISGSGKTSLLKEVKKILSLKYKVDHVPEISGKNPFDNDKKSTFTSQFFYLSTQVNEENVHSINPLEYLLCDRSILDQWIYWKCSVLDKEFSEKLKIKNGILEDLYRFWIKTYDLIFLIRLDLKKLDSREFDKELRKIDSEYIKTREKVYLETIKEDNLKVFEIWNNNTIDESAQKIVQTISEYKHSTEVPE
ncbi:MAG: AAA family ATPase [Candidatus Aminicenantes bacterium]|nr:AAA family ATPase [Candidatus Aminicenantes bacterium]